MRTFIFGLKQIRDVVLCIYFGCYSCGPRCGCAKNSFIAYVVCANSALGIREGYTAERAIYHEIPDAAQIRTTSPRNFVFRTLENKVTSPNDPVGTGRTSQGKRKVRKGTNLLTFCR